MVDSATCFDQVLILLLTQRRTSEKTQVTIRYLRKKNRGSKKDKSSNMRLHVFGIQLLNFSRVFRVTQPFNKYLW